MFLCFLQLLLQIGHVGIGVTVAFRLAETYAIDDGGMVQRIGDDCVFFAKKRLKKASIGIEAGSIKDGIVGIEKITDGFFQFLVVILRSADEANRRYTVTALVEGILCCCNKPWMIRKTEVVVGTKVEYLLPRLYLYLGTLRCDNNPFIFIEACVLYGFQLSLQVLLHFSVHTLVVAIF